MRTILVTGAEGFLGGRLVAQLRAGGHHVVAGVRNRARKLAYERQHVPALVCEITDAINVARVVASASPDAVVHLAGITRPGIAAAEPLLAYQSIVSSCANLLDAVRRAVPRARILLVSAADIYGNAGQDGHPLAEDTRPEPVTTFGSLKRAAESIAHTFHRDYHLDLSIVRPFQYTGPGHPERFFVGAIARQLSDWDRGSAGDELRLPDLSCERDWLHVDDVAEAYERVLFEGRPNEVYNVCSGQARSCRSLVEKLAQGFGLQLRFAELPLSQDEAHVRCLCGDNSKLRHELSWEPRRSVDEALGELVSSYQAEALAAR